MNGMQRRQRREERERTGRKKRKRRRGVCERKGETGRGEKAGEMERRQRDHDTSPPSLACSLEVERHHLGAAEPQAEGVIVGGVNPLALGVDAGQTLLVVPQKVDGLLPHDAVSLGLDEGADFPEIRVFCTQSSRSPCSLGLSSR